MKGIPIWVKNEDKISQSDINIKLLRNFIKFFSYTSNCLIEFQISLIIIRIKFYFHEIYPKRYKNIEKIINFRGINNLILLFLDSVPLDFYS